MPNQDNQNSTNNLALVSLIAGIGSWTVFPLIAAIIAIITGHMARAEIRKTGQDGNGFAIAGLITGYLNLFASCLFFGFFVLVYLGIFGAIGFGVLTGGA